MTRTMALLGAGASADAEIPTSTLMTERIGKQIASPTTYRNGVLPAFNFAVGALIAHKAASGANPYLGIDVEELFAAIQMLGDKRSVEIAPFVSWSPVLQTIGPAKSSPAFFDENFRESILGGRNALHRPGVLIASFVESMLDEKDSERTFQALEREMLNALTRLLVVDPMKIDYLSPLLNLGDGAIDIATLNYDRSIEVLAEAQNVRVDTGIETWTGGHDWSWEPSARLRLLKLHGSIDWILTSKRGQGGMQESRIVSKTSALGDNERFYSAPGVVFGTRGKLKAQGPFLAMLGAFDDMLSAADRLIVVGYSFRDHHINVALTRWINSAPHRKLTIIDPGFNEAAQVRGSFPEQLFSATKTYNGGRREDLLDLEVISERAREGLARVIPYPRPRADSPDTVINRKGLVTKPGAVNRTAATL